MKIAAAMCFQAAVFAVRAHVGDRHKLGPVVLTYAEEEPNPPHEPCFMIREYLFTHPLSNDGLLSIVGSWVPAEGAAHRARASATIPIARIGIHTVRGVRTQIGARRFCGTFMDPGTIGIPEVRELFGMREAAA